MTMHARSFRVLLLCLIPITLWTFCFFLIYGAETLACVLPSAAPHTAFWIAPIASAAIALGAVVFASRRLQLNRDKDYAEGFLAKASVELAGLAALATIWIELASAAIPQCALPS